MNTLNYDVARIRCCDLTPYQCALIELREQMQGIRKLANEIRLKPWMRGRNSADYLVGRLHGIRFSWSTLLIYQTCDYEAFAWEADAYMAEADFLLGQYSRAHEEA